MGLKIKSVKTKYVINRKDKWTHVKDIQIGRENFEFIKRFKELGLFIGDYGVTSLDVKE